MFDRIKGWLGFGASETGPTYLLSDPRVGEVFSLGTRATAGVSVTQETALSCSAWWRAVDLRSSAVGKMPYGVYSALPDGKGNIADPSHEWSYALSHKPGEHWTAFHYRKLMEAWVMTRGNAYAFIDRTARQLTPIDPDSMNPVVGADGKLWYHYSKNGKFYHPDEILHYKGLSFDGLSGKGVLEAASESLGLNMGAKRFQSATLKNSARPSVILRFPKKLQDPQKKQIISDWERMVGGSDNANRTTIVDGEFEVVPFSMSASDIGLIETQKWTVLDIANFTGVPAHKLGNKDAASYNSLEQETLAWNTDTLEATFAAIEQEDSDKLLSEAEKLAGSHIVMFDRVRAAFQSADLAGKMNYLKGALGGAPYMKISEARKLDGLNHEDGTDEIPKPTNMGGGQNDPKNPADPSPGRPSARLKEATAAALDQGIKRVFKRLGSQAKAATKRGELAGWLATVERDNLSPVSSELGALEVAVSESHGIDLCTKVTPQILSRLISHFQSGRDAESLDQLTIQLPEA